MCSDDFGIGTSTSGRKTDIEQAIMQQRKFFESGHTKDYAFRKNALLKLQTAIRQYKEDFVEALQKDLRKSAEEAILTEIGLVSTELAYNISHLRRWMKPKKVMPTLTQFPGKCYISPEPYGVVLVMAPWNYPLLLCMEPLINAIAAGNCVVLKPSAYASETSKILAKMLGGIYPEDYVLVVEGGRKENARLLDCRFDKILFTGGAEVGQQVLLKAAEHMTPVTLELGGKSPCIVEESADLKLAAKRIAFGKLLNSGQTCVAPDYLILYDEIKEPFLEYYRQEVHQMLGDEPLKNPNYPKMVNDKHYNRVMNLIAGEHVYMGGYGKDDSLQIAPTVLDEVTLDSPVMQEEIFGPVLPVVTVSSKEEMLTVIRHFEKPLACYLFTENKQMKNWALKHLSFGGGCINDTVIHLTTSRMGFGGVGASGMGSYHGKEGFDCFSHRRSIVEQGTWFDLPLRYHPYASWKTKILKKILRVK